MRVIDIARATADHYGCSLREVLSARQNRRFSRHRQLTAWLAQKLTDRSYSAIGRAMERNHATVLHAVAKIETAMETEPGLRADAEAIAGRLRTRLSEEPLRRTDAARAVDYMVKAALNFADATEARPADEVHLLHELRRAVRALDAHFPTPKENGHG